MNTFNPSVSDPNPEAETESQKSWQPLTRSQRRVVGVLVEKAKTTPDAYPMTLNALTTGCNQKSNRSPLMNLDVDDVMDTLEQLRDMGAVAEVQSGGRVPKYKHYMYEWLGVDKHELAVMTELLLRGEQTVGELRGRASRMETIADMHQLRPVLDSLIAKNLMVELQPPGRGQMVTHNLYEPRELEAIKERSASQASTPAASPRATPPAPATPQLTETVEQLKAEIQELRQRVAELESQAAVASGRLRQPS